MDIIKFSIRNPVVVLVGVILATLFGVLSLYQMPYQLSPDVSKPEITVETTWPGATPSEIERDIIEEQEEALKSIPALTEIESSSLNNLGQITLTFELGTPILEALLRTSNKLDEVETYPENVDKPIVDASGANASPVIWMMFQAIPGTDANPNLERTFFENRIRQYLERVEGVSNLFVAGGRERQMHVIIDPRKMAAFGVTVDDVIAAIGRDNINISAGDVNIGRRNYRIRTLGEYKSPKDVTETVIKGYGDRFVKLGDVADVEFGYEKAKDVMLFNGNPGIAIGVVPQVGVNILDMTARTKDVTDRLNEEFLKDRNLELVWAYEQRPYIQGAIDLVQQNIMIGGVLAIAVLLVFLGNIASTLIVSIAIPISILGTFIFLNGFGRNLNVISLAGISFSVGMLVDNAIVVLENIDRHRSMGKSPFAAAYDGTTEVWGAVVASTLTTVAVFLPVIFIQEEAGQLFKDIAIAVTCAISLSLVVSITVIPMLADRLYTLSSRITGKAERGKPRITLFFGIGRMASKAIMALVRLCLSNMFTRSTTAVILVLAAVGLSWMFFPKLEYLPQGNRNLLINILIPPPGLSYEEKLDIGRQVNERLQPYYNKEEVNGVPGIKHVFFVAVNNFFLFGVISMQEQRAAELIPMLSGLTNSFPGVFGVSLQQGIFSEGIGEGRNVDVDIQGGDLNKIIAAAGALFGTLKQAMPTAQVRPIPSFEMIYPEVQFVPNMEKLKSVGMDNRSLGIILDVLNDGRDIGDFKEEGEKKIELVLKGSREDVSTPDELFHTLVVTPEGELLPVNSLAEMIRATSVTEIRHRELDRTITLQVTPPPEMPLESCMETIQNQILPKLKQAGLFDDLHVNLSGAADKLTETWGVLQDNFVLAIIITYLLMSALFSNFLYPLIIMFTVPLAAAGGFVGLKLVNWFIAPQPLDILTMLGFVMLIGVVVNNAILIVHQALNNIREHDMSPRQAVETSVETRLRPIYMSATTSVLGMLPLVVAPGPGSELYRGLGSVVLGGLAISTVFTIFLIPVLLLGLLKTERRIVGE
ncbi:efflux RND transporter permease subunit [Desulfovibrio inopinatus]|uniref:efflux RND transporter permease subunit n=1 Tax=Desulfovibrio inopinatus TaxID=102109 RepID=UPI000411AF84|nr:efflux RND transporter permease subunit [Desulfovibrio inopinatus]